jgi:hypothetical protein
LEGGGGCCGKGRERAVIKELFPLCLAEPLNGSLNGGFSKEVLSVGDVEQCPGNPINLSLDSIPFWPSDISSTYIQTLYLYILSVISTFPSVCPPPVLSINY